MQKLIHAKINSAKLRIQMNHQWNEIQKYEFKDKTKQNKTKQINISTSNNTEEVQRGTTVYMW